MATASNDRVPCSSETKQRIKAAKRGGETYDELFRKMLKQYDPDVANRPAIR
jgi:hypothetical protein